LNRRCTCTCASASSSVSLGRTHRTEASDVVDGCSCRVWCSDTSVLGAFGVGTRGPGASPSTSRCVSWGSLCRRVLLSYQQHPPSYSTRSLTNDSRTKRASPRYTTGKPWLFWSGRGLSVDSTRSTRGSRGPESQMARRC
jgi:hypothetical protein